MLSYAKLPAQPVSLALHQARELLKLALADLNNSARDWYDTMNMFDRAIAFVKNEMSSMNWQDEENILIMECLHGKIKNALTFNEKGSDQLAMEISQNVVDAYKSSSHHGKASYEYYLAAAAAMMHFINEKIAARDIALLSEPSAEKLVHAVCSVIKDFNHKLASYALMPRMTDDHAAQLSRLHYQLSRFYQFTCHYESALEHGNLAIHIRSVRGYKTRDEFLELAKMYAELAACFHFDAAYAQLFNFASDFFSGKNPVNFQRYLELERQFEPLQDPDFSHREALLELMRIISSRAAEPALPDSELKQQLNYAAQFHGLRCKYEDQESSHIADMLAARVKEVPLESPPLTRRATELLHSAKKKTQKFFKPKSVESKEENQDNDKDEEKKSGMEKK